MEANGIARIALMGLALTAAIVVGAFNMPRQKPPLVLTPVTANQETTSSSKVMVHVIGEVANPGLYPLEPGARINDAIEKAGGKTEYADVSAVNLAARVEDGQQIVVPTQEDFQPVEVQPFAGMQGSIENSPPQARRKTTIPKTTKTKIPTIPKSPGKTTSAKKGDSLSAGSISINRASSAELEKLPGIGPATAANIIGYRRENGPFSRIDDLISVRGIGPKKLAAIRKFVRL